MPAAARCPSADELQAYAVGRLEDDLADQIAEHLETCTDCQAAIATLDDADDTLVTSLRLPAEEDPHLAESQCQAAVARAAAIPSVVAAFPAEATTFSRAGEMLGEYRLLNEIGRGGMGRVYRALQTKLDRIVALKILPHHRAEDERAIARFEREMKAIGRLDHPNIVRAYDAREIDGNPVLIMEYVEGRDLAEVLHYLGRIDVADACELIRQAALGLQYAQDNGLVHRDIKPSNLMLTPQGQVKVLDLGLARFEHPAANGEEMTGVGQPMGTADYMAPEQVSDSRSADIRADVYSLGCTLFKLLTGQSPFDRPEGRGTFDKMTAHVSEPPPTIRDFDSMLPQELSDLVASMLAKSPDDRPATPAEVAEALTPFTSDADLSGVESMVAIAQRQNDAFERLHSAPSRLSQEPEKLAPATAAAGHSGWFWGAIAALMLLVGGGGFALGVIITIERNGKSTQVEVPDGSQVAIDDQANMSVKLPDDGKSSSAPAAATDDFEAIQGIWKVVDRKGKAPSHLVNGSLLSAKQKTNSDGTYTDQWKSSQIVFDGHYLRVVGPHELPTSYEYQLNPAGSPKMIDVYVNAQNVLGVYELRGNRLRVCLQWKEEGTPVKRPSTVWAGLNTAQEMLELQRVSSVTEHADYENILGKWIVKSAELRNRSESPEEQLSGSYILPQGTIAPGRGIVFTPDSMIIDPASPAELIEANRSQQDDKPYGGGSEHEPLARSSEFTYCLDPTRHWISVGRTGPYPSPQPGIYEMSAEQLVIRVDTPERPKNLSGPAGKDEMLLTLVRPDSAAGKQILATSKPPKIPEMLVTVDALGGVTAIYGDNRDYLGSNEETILAAIEKIIVKHSVQVLTLRRGKGAPRSYESAINDLAQRAGLRSVNVTGGDVPLGPVKLDFRIAAVRDTPELPGLSDGEVNLIRYALKNASDRQAQKIAEKYDYAIVELSPSVRSNIPEDIATSSSSAEILLSNAPDQTMLSSDTGERNWNIEHAELTEDPSGSPSISLTLDEAGGKRLRELTRQNLKRPLAIVINDIVYAVPRIQSEITSKVMVSGIFSEDLAQQLVDAFNAIAPESEKIRQMLIMVDPLGGVTVKCGFEREHLGGNEQQAIERITDIIKRHRVEAVELRAVGGGGTIGETLSQKAEQLGLRDINVRGGPVPLAPVSLGFRIAAENGSAGLPGLKMTMLESPHPQKVLEQEDSELAKKYMWVPIDADSAKSLRENAKLVTNLVPASPYLLVSREPAKTMLGGDTGKRAWKILGAELASSSEIALTLNSAGGKRLGDLTGDNMNRHLAVIINNKVYMAPKILAKITDKIQITGNFDEPPAKNLVEAFNAAAKEE